MCLTAERFQGAQQLEVTTIPHSAVDYFQGLRQRHPQAWSMMSAGSKLARRLLVDGESGLRQCFLAAYEQVGRSVCALNFMETDYMQMILLSFVV